MIKEKEYLTPKEAAELLDCSAKSIINYINQKKIKADKDQLGFYLIHKAEFFRDYPQAFMALQERNEGKMNDKISIKFLEKEITHLKDMLAEKKKENEFLKDQNSISIQEKNKMLDAINSHTRLLEHKEAIEKPKEEPNENTVEKEDDKKMKKFSLFGLLKQK